MEKQPLVSIIVPVFKVEKYLDNCVQSVLAQTYSNWELILVDDGSPDRCPAMCDKYACQERRITVLHQKNSGQSSARNRALDCPPKGEYITFLDSDDFWHKNFLSSLVKLVTEYKAEIAQCEFVKGSDKVFPYLEEIVMLDTYDSHKIFLSERANIVMWGKLFRKSLFEDIRMPVGLYNEDDWTMWKIYYRANTIVLTSEKLYYYTVNPASTMARLSKKPDLRYINAYKERIDFFIGTGEKDMEHCSRLQLCKSLVLTYRNKQLQGEDRKLLKNIFNRNWKELIVSPYIAKKYKLLFSMFYVIPLFSSKLAAKLHSRK